MDSGGLLFPIAASALAAAASGLIGPFVLARRATYAAGAVSHSMMGGIGLAAFCASRFGWEWFTPFWGALLAALSAAAALSLITGKTNARIDAVLSGIWTGGFATGIVLMVAATGEEGDVEEYLLGSLMEADGTVVVKMSVLAAVSAMAILPGYNKLLAVSFDKRLAALRGVNVVFWDAVFSMATALAVALIAHTGGILMAIALLTLPAAASSQFCGSMRQQMAFSFLFAFCAGIAGIAAGKTVNPLFSSAASVFFLLAVCAAAAFVSKKRRTCHG